MLGNWRFVRSVVVIVPVPPAMGKVRVRFPAVSTVPVAIRSALNDTQGLRVEFEVRRIPVTVGPEDCRSPVRSVTG
jgi:hypothetical protein